MADGHRYRPSQELRIVRGPIAPDWKGNTVTIIASGPSLNGGQIASIREAWQAGLTRVIGVNDAYKCAPWIDGLYAADPPWWEYHIKAVRDTHIPLLMCQDDEASQRWGLRHIPGPPEGKAAGVEGISTNPDYIHFGSNSGFQALNIAFLMGAAKIILVGYDMHTKAGEPTHWFGEHPQVLTMHRDYHHWVKFFNQSAPQFIAAGVRVVNCSPGSAIKCFETGSVTMALRRQ